MKVLWINGSPHKQGCTACGACAGLGKCVFDDDPANEMLELMREAVVSARRSGTTATFDRLNKYFTVNRMPIISSQYWNGIHGFTPEDVRKDQEGMQTMRTLGYNMAWMLKNIADGRQPLPKAEPWQPTHFIRS